ncbi:dolichyl-phosphate mannose synthase [Candidatus Woesearchaeota archaeon B3_Woes]|nr:MAG: dolichyl-phosphate mannose synthase [Candidatus Woesearchaeota archaeon B3_Woes]
MIDKNVWVVIPAYNESKHILDVIKKTKKYCSNILVVDDGSKDDTFKVAKKTNIIVLKHIINLGKGAAAKTGCDFALKKGAKKIILMDSDGQHDSSEIHKFLKALEEVDIVFGYRKFNKKMPFILKFGNNSINFITKLLYGVNLRDTQCGYRALRAKAYKKARWRSNGYSMESEMIANIGKRNLKYKEIPIQTIYSDRYKGTTIFDGIKIVFNMFLWRLKK